MAVMLAVVGATGAVGELMRLVLSERSVPFRSIKFLASERSAFVTEAVSQTSSNCTAYAPTGFAA